MKHLKNIALASVLCAGTCLSAEGQTVPPAIPSDPEIRLPSLLTPKSKPTSKIGSRK